MHYTSLFTLAIVLLLPACATVPKGGRVNYDLYDIIYNDDLVGRVKNTYSSQGNIFKKIKIVEFSSQFKGNKPDRFISEEIQEYSLDGNVQKFYRLDNFNGIEKAYRGEIRGATWYWEESYGGRNFEIAVSAPQDFKMEHQVENSMQTLSSDVGKLEYSRWNRRLRQFETMELKVLQSNSLVGAHKVQKLCKSCSEKYTEEYWVDDEFKLFETKLSMFGSNFEVKKCVERCNEDDYIAIQPLEYLVLDSPYKINLAALKGEVRYSVVIDSLQAIPDTGEQLAGYENGVWQLDICAGCPRNLNSENIDLTEYLVDNRWLDTSNPALILVAKNKLNDSMSDEEKMHRLTSVVQKRLSKNLQFVGYLNASQAYEERTGDCTEYALLLASLGRIAGVPTRILMGVSYSRKDFHGIKHKFIPHAWVQAWVGGRWKSFDAGLGAFDAGHIALKVSDGSQIDFIEMVKLLQKMQISSAQHIIRRGEQKIH